MVTLALSPPPSPRTAYRTAVRAMALIEERGLPHAGMVLKGQDKSVLTGNIPAPSNTWSIELGCLLESIVVDSVAVTRHPVTIPARNAGTTHTGMVHTQAACRGLRTW